MEQIGGQAVIEGVMMRHGNKVVVATLKKGRITVKRIKFRSLTGEYMALGLPFVRGVIHLFETVVLGIKTLVYSANEIEEKEEKLGFWELFLTLAIAVLFSIGVFIVLPYFLTGFLSRDKGILFNLIDGMIRVVLFVAYVVIISMMKDIRRVFEYHGAEHKAVNCYEHKRKLTIENCSKFSTVHRRCGTTFLMIVLAVSIVIFSLIISEKWYWRIGLRIVLIPVIAGISYELLKLAAKYEGNLLLRILIYPGLLLQKITTRKPARRQIEVAIRALRAVS